MLSEHELNRTARLGPHRQDCLLWCAVVLGASGMNGVCCGVWCFCLWCMVVGALWCMVWAVCMGCAVVHGANMLAWCALWCMV